MLQAVVVLTASTSVSASQAANKSPARNVYRFGCRKPGFGQVESADKPRFGGALFYASDPFILPFIFPPSGKRNLFVFYLIAYQQTKAEARSKKRADVRQLFVLRHHRLIIRYL